MSRCVPESRHAPVPGEHLRVVFAAGMVPIPARSGAPIRTSRLLTGLGERFDVVFVGLDAEPGSTQEPPTRDEIARELPGVKVCTVRAPRGRKRLRQLLSLASRRSWDCSRYATTSLRDAVHAATHDHRARLIHFDDPGAALGGPVPGVVNTVAPHNIEHEIQRAAAASSSGVRRTFARIEARKVLREERAQWRWSDICVAVSEADASAMRRGGARKVVVVPNGTDPIPRGAAPRWSSHEALRLLFVGADYLPNRTGLEWFIREVLPMVRRQISVALDVVGMPESVTPVSPDVRAHGRVASVDPFYAAAHAAVVPIFFGSGTRLKVIEAMARGVPVVSTSTGAAGLPVSPGEHYLRADDAASFASALVGLSHHLARPSQRLETMLAAARSVAEELFWPRIVQHMASAYEAALVGSAGIATRRYSA